MNDFKQYTAAIIIFITSVLGISQVQASGDDMYVLQDLRGPWKFTIGDQQAWADPYYNDADWEMLQVPGAWEDQGFHGYNGYAWYRKSFRTTVPNNADLYLVMGYIDDIDEVYLNGELIGFSGDFPPAYQTAYKAYRVYPVPRSLIHQHGENVISVRVYDHLIAGGILSGPIGLYAKREAMPLEVNLAGPWEFRLGDDAPWEDDDADLQDWNRIMVPGSWENAGYHDYDGYAWYRKSFRLTRDQVSKDLILMLGKIDDVDQVFINGKFIGATGLEDYGPIEENDSDSYRKTRAYRIPAYMLDPNEVHTITIRVFDWTLDGGMYEGRIGLVPHSIYKQFFKG